MRFWFIFFSLLDSEIFLLDWKNFWSLRICSNLLVYSYCHIWSGHYWFWNLTKQLNILTDQRLLRVYLIRVTRCIFVLGLKDHLLSICCICWNIFLRKTINKSNKTSKKHTYTHKYILLYFHFHILQTCLRNSKMTNFYYSYIFSCIIYNNIFLKYLIYILKYIKYILYM